MANDTKAAGQAKPKEIHFSDKDAGAKLPPIPEGAAPPAAGAERATIEAWAAQAGHIPPRVPKGGFLRRGDRFKGFDVRILMVHLSNHGAFGKKHYRNSEYTREEYDALVKEAQSVPFGSTSPMREAVESLEAFKGGFRPRQSAPVEVKES